MVQFCDTLHSTCINLCTIFPGKCPFSFLLRALRVCESAAGEDAVHALSHAFFSGRLQQEAQ